MQTKTYKITEHVIDFTEKDFWKFVDELVNVTVKPTEQIDILWRTRFSSSSNGNLDSIRINHGGIKYSQRNYTDSSPFERIIDWFDWAKNKPKLTIRKQPGYYLKIIVKESEE